MRHLCCSKIFILLLLLWTSVFADERYAFVYSKNIDDRFINFYDKVVVEADAVDNIYALRYPKKMVAYVSVGEIEPWRKTKNKYNKSWIISENRTWNSLIADLRKSAYQAFIFERIAYLYKQGYRNFFLDTMDAYHVTGKDKKLFKLQQDALVLFIHTLHQKYPDSKIIVNRGFEILEQIHQDIDAVVAESLLNRYNHTNKEYILVPKKDREWLMANFKKAKEYGLDVVSIEYSDKSTKERLNIAKRIKKLGFIPYVTDGLLQEQGECDTQRIRRDVLILFNKSMFKDKNAVYSDVHLLASMPLEHWGYVPILYDISTQDLPKRVEDKYHSVIVWSEGKTKNSEAFYAWAKVLKEKNIKILFLNSLIFKPSVKNLESFGLSITQNHNKFIEKIATEYKKPYQRYEIPASIQYEEELISAKDARPVIRTLYQNGQTSIPMAITPWGGYALHDSLLHNIVNENYWTVNPFTFFKDALRLDNIPVPDPTTEAGRRILFVHIDGDGFMEIVRTEPDTLASEYLLKHIYRKYKIPQTVSLVQGEVDTIGLYPKLSHRMKRVAREIYQIPWIEPASHTLSHPFFWGEADENEQRKRDKNRVIRKAEKHYHLPIKNYEFNLRRETKESVDFVLSLAPKSKQKERIIFWSGDCLPTKVVLAYCERDGIIGMNGGDTTIQKSDPWLSHIAPFGLQREAYWQIYTAQQNENVYTHDWLGPFWGYRDAIETFKMTEEPYRLKPINVYYHFYSGSKLASFNALDKVYSWAIKQKTSKLYASQYIKKARGFYRTAIGKIKGGYEIRNSGFLRTVRFDKKVTIDIAKSLGVAGFQHHNETTYVTLDRREKRIINLNENHSAPYLMDSNGWVDLVEQEDGKKYHFTLHSNVALEANFYLPQMCRVLSSKELSITKRKNSVFVSSKRKGVDVVFKCQ
jgi:hypothetical protein